MLHVPNENPDGIKGKKKSDTWQNIEFITFFF